MVHLGYYVDHIGSNMVHIGSCMGHIGSYMVHTGFNMTHTGSYNVYRIRRPLKGVRKAWVSVVSPSWFLPQTRKTEMKPPDIFARAPLKLQSSPEDEYA